MPRVHKMVVVEADIEEVKQHPDNANNGDVDAIEESIEVNGLYSPIWVQRSTGYIIKGNHTYLAAARLGLLQVPVIYLDVTDTQAKRIMVADNQVARLGYTDEGLLKGILDELYATDPGLAGTGYDVGQYMDLTQQVEQTLTYSDDIDDEKEPTRERESLGVNLLPIKDDGEVWSLELTKIAGGVFTRREYQKIRRALGLQPDDDASIRAYEVDSWN